MRAQRRSSTTTCARSGRCSSAGGRSSAPSIDLLAPAVELVLVVQLVSEAAPRLEGGAHKPTRALQRAVDLRIARLRISHPTRSWPQKPANALVGWPPPAWIAQARFPEIELQQFAGTVDGALIGPAAVEQRPDLAQVVIDDRLYDEHEIEVRASDARWPTRRSSPGMDLSVARERCGRRGPTPKAQLSQGVRPALGRSGRGDRLMGQARRDDVDQRALPGQARPLRAAGGRRRRGALRPARARDVDRRRMRRRACTCARCARGLGVVSVDHLRLAARRKEGSNAGSPRHRPNRNCHRDEGR
jgi:hypothetical protein